MESSRLLVDDGNGGLPDQPRWCAVTGGRGFMARHLVAALLRSGEWCVRVTDLEPDIVLGHGETEQLLGDALRDGRAIYAPANVCNLDQLTKAFEGIDVVFHTACADYTKNDSQLHYKVNVEGTKTVIDACRICKVKRLIYTSSSAVVFDGVHGYSNVNESEPYPDKFFDSYAQTKAEAEKLVIKANGTSEILTCCIRPGSIFGPGDKIVSIANYYGRILVIIGDGKNYDDFVYVENVVHAHIYAERALRTKEGAQINGGKAYFISNMEQMNLWDFNYMVREELGYKSPFRIRIPLYVMLPISYVLEWIYKLFPHYGMHQPQITPAMIKYATLNRTFSCNKAVEELGYRPIVSLKDGVRIAAKSYIHLRDLQQIKEGSSKRD